LRILNYPKEAQIATPRDVQEHVRRIFHTDGLTTRLRSADFLSGRRRYVCRPFFLESIDGNPRPLIVVILLERRSREPVDVSEISRRFHLSPRERETVQYLIRGLTTKEVGERMSVSPNTVKQFVRLIMSKMRVTTRLGVVGKILGA